MANVANAKLKYTPIDAGFSRKPMCLMIRAKFGILGQAMAYEVLAWITESGGCYAEWNDDKPAEFASTRMFDLSLIGKVREVFEFMVEIGFFDQTAFKAGFLTSEGIVKRWWRAKKALRHKSPLDDLPGPVRAVADRVISAEKDSEDDADENFNNATTIPNNDTGIANNATTIPNNDTGKRLKDIKDIKLSLVPPLTPPTGGNEGGGEPVQDSLPEDGLTDTEREVIEAWNRTFPAGDPRHLPGPPYPLNGFFKPNLFRALQSGLTTKEIAEAFAVLRDSDHAWQLHSAVKSENVRLLLTEKRRKRTRAAPKDDTTRYTSQERYRSYAVKPALAGGTQ